MVLLLPAIVKLVTLQRIGTLIALVAVNLACLLMNLFHTGSFAFIWVPPAILAVYALGTRPCHSISPSPFLPLSRSTPKVAV